MHDKKTGHSLSQAVDDTGHSKTSEGPIKPVKPANIHISTLLYPSDHGMPRLKIGPRNPPSNHWVNCETRGCVQL